MNGKYLTERERYKLEGLFKSKTKKTEIAKIMNISLKTVYNEYHLGETILKNPDWTFRTEYLADVAQRKSMENQSKKGAIPKALKSSELISYLEDMLLNKKYSPYAILQEMQKNNIIFDIKVCEKTIYNLIYRKNINVTKKQLPMPRKHRQTSHSTPKMALHNLTGRSIEERPKSLKLRDTFGHWEMDTVYSGQTCKAKDCLLVLTERKTRLEEIYRMKSKSKAETVRILNQIENSIGVTAFKERYLSITSDNGVEFYDYDNMITASDGTQRCDYYYCHPYSSYERGSNENQNKLIRRFIPKGADISKYTDEYIKQIETWMNNYPRKLFDGLSANEMYAKEA